MIQNMFHRPETSRIPLYIPDHIPRYHPINRYFPVFTGHPTLHIICNLLQSRKLFIEIHLRVGSHHHNMPVIVPTAFLQVKIKLLFLCSLVNPPEKTGYLILQRYFITGRQSDIYKLCRCIPRQPVSPPGIRPHHRITVGYSHALHAAPFGNNTAGQFQKKRGRTNSTPAHP